MFACFPTLNKYVLPVFPICDTEYLSFFQLRFAMALSNDYETVIATRKGGKNVVVLFEEAYNNLLENAYLTASKANYDWLLESKAIPQTLLED